MALAPDGARREGPAEAYRLTSPSPSPPPPPYSLCNAFPPKVRAARRLLSIGPCVFSVGDFLGAVSLLRDLIDALQEGGSTSGERDELITELRSLDTAILQLEAHYTHIESPAQRMALDQAAQACQMSINDFLKNVRERQREASVDDSGDAVRGRYRDMRWGLATTEDIGTFRCRIFAHVQSIQTLLVTIQVSSAETDHRKDDTGLNDSTQIDLRNHTNHSLVLINESFNTLRRALVNQGSVAQQTLANVDALRQIMMQVLRKVLFGPTLTLLCRMNNLQMLSALKQLQDNLPPQVLLQRPVIFTDALERIAPIHLDWIDTWDAFLAVLEVRFAHLGYNKVKRREFALQERASRKDLSFTRPIGMCLTAGKHVDMSMIFQDQAGVSTSNTCPHCQAPCEGSTHSETICTQCGCQFHRVQQQYSQTEAIRNVMSIEAIVGQVAAGVPQKRKRSTESKPEHEVRPIDFKRLRLMCSMLSRKKRRSVTSRLQDPQGIEQEQPRRRVETYQIPQEEAQESHTSQGLSQSPHNDWIWRTPYPLPNSMFSYTYNRFEKQPPMPTLYATSAPKYDQPATRRTDTFGYHQNHFPAELLSAMSTADTSGLESADWGSRAQSVTSSSLSSTIPIHSAQQWEAQRNTINQLYRVEGCSLMDIGKVMKMQHGFSATARQYKSRLAAWGFRRHMIRAERETVIPPASFLTYNALPETDESATDDRDPVVLPLNTSSYDNSTHSFNNSDFIPGPQESILSRIETPALNSTTGWSNPGWKATARDEYDLDASWPFRQLTDDLVAS